MKCDFLFAPRIDEAAFAGFDAFSSGARMPAWVADNDLLCMAWQAGRRQAEDKARETAPRSH